MRVKSVKQIRQGCTVGSRSHTRVRPQFYLLSLALALVLLVSCPLQAIPAGPKFSLDNTAVQMSDGQGFDAIPRGVDFLPDTASGVRLRPTLLIVTHGYQPTRVTGLAMWRGYAEAVYSRLQHAGSPTVTWMVDWNSWLSGERPSSQLAAMIRVFLNSQSEPWDLVLLGHSRGAILENETLNQLGSVANLGYVEEILLDPTASPLMHDSYPDAINPNFHAKIYDDGYQLLPSTIDGRPVSGASYMRVRGKMQPLDFQIPIARGIISHCAIQDWYLHHSNEFVNDIGEVIAQKPAAVYPVPGPEGFNPEYKYLSPDFVITLEDVANATLATCQYLVGLGLDAADAIVSNTLGSIPSDVDVVLPAGAHADVDRCFADSESGCSEWFSWLGAGNTLVLQKTEQAIDRVPEPADAGSWNLRAEGTFGLRPALVMERSAGVGKNAAHSLGGDLATDIVEHQATDPAGIKTGHHHADDPPQGTAPRYDSMCGRWPALEADS
jgi:hypothetical protein